MPPAGPGDIKTNPPPSSGNAGLIIGGIVGLALLGAGVGAVVYSQRKRKRR